MAGEPDVRVAGVSHEQIYVWVNEGKADKSTHILENRMQSIINALQTSGDEVNKAVQQANGGDWEGSTAQSASTAMTTLRDFDDDMHTHGTNNRYSAMGQSGESAATRHQVPPVPASMDAPPTIAGSTMDPRVRITARQNAEDHAREVLANYNLATQQRLNSMPKVQSAPKVVLSTGDDKPGGGAKPKGPSGSGGHSPAPTPHGDGGRTASGSSNPSTGTSSGGTHGDIPTVPGGTPTQNTSASSVVPTVPPTNAPPTVGGPSGPAYGNPGPTGGTGPFGGMPIGDGGGPGGTGRFGGSGQGGSGPGGSQGGPGQSGSRQGGEGGSAGRGSGAQTGARPGLAAAEDSAIGRRGAVAGRGGAVPGGMLGGGGHGAGGDDDAEHMNRYALPSDEHFDDEDGEFLRDPRNGEFYVAPDVIGGPE